MSGSESTAPRAVKPPQPTTRRRDSTRARNFNARVDGEGLRAELVGIVLHEVVVLDDVQLEAIAFQRLSEQAPLCLRLADRAAAAKAEDMPKASYGVRLRPVVGSP